MQAYYEYHLRCGSGRIKAITEFLDDEHATIYYDLLWMGIDELIRYQLVWKRQIVTDTHGILKLEGVRRYESREGDTASLLDLDVLLKVSGSNQAYRDFQREVTYEYLILPQTLHIAEDDQLEHMRLMGAAHWHETFDLLLLLNYSVNEHEGLLKGTVFGDILRKLDKMKFTAVGHMVFRS